MDPCARSLPRRPARAARGQGRRDVSRRHWCRAQHRGDRRRHPGRAGKVALVEDHRGRPPRPRSPLLARRLEDRCRARLEAAGRLRRRSGGDGGVVRPQPAVVGASAWPGAGCRERVGVGELAMRVLMTGAAGALGHDLAIAFADHEVVACDHATLDVTDRDRVLQVVGAVRPDVVVNAAAWTDVDGCEGDPDRAFAVNALAVRHVAEAAGQVGAWMCQLSTDYVFDGRAPAAYVEWDDPNPLSVYGRSKLGGEHEVGERATVVRSSWLAGVTGRSFVRTMLAAAARGEPLRVVDDEVGSPTFTPDLAAMIRRLVTERRPGLHHVTNQGTASRYALAVEALRLAGFDAGSVEPNTA